MQLFKRIVDAVNIPKHVSNHLVGRNHTHVHRKFFGVVVMVIGVFIVKTLMVIDSFLIHLAADVIGFGVHGIGLIPFVEGVEHAKETEHSPQNTEI